MKKVIPFVSVLTVTGFIFTCQPKNKKNAAEEKTAEAPSQTTPRRKEELKKFENLPPSHNSDSLANQLAQAKKINFASSWEKLNQTTPQDWKTNAKLLTYKNCNAVSYSQVPSTDGFFLGRKQNTATPEDCKGTAWSLTLNHFDWNSKTITVIKDVLDTRTPIPIEKGSRTLATAYDPYLVVFADKTWVAFECHGTNFPGSAATCVGQLNRHWQIDPSTIYTVIEGRSHESSDKFHHSASVPKFLVHGEKLYLYWTSVQIEIASGNWQKLVTRGVELTVDENKTHVWPVGKSAAIAANDPATTLVWDVSNGANANKVADLFDVQSDGTWIYALGGAGGGQCLTPLAAEAGCYRMVFMRTKNPLAANTFSQEQTPEAKLPSNPHEYSRFVSDPSGQTLILAQLLASTKSESSRLLPPGLTLLPLSDESQTKPICDPATKPFPTFGAVGGACLPSCGSLGGTQSYADSCTNHNLTQLGAAYDVANCCK